MHVRDENHLYLKLIDYISAGGERTRSLRVPFLNVPLIGSDDGGLSLAVSVTSS